MSFYSRPINQINGIQMFWSRSMAITRNLLLFVIAKWEEIGPSPPDLLASRLLLGGHCYLDVLTGLHSPALSCHSPDCDQTDAPELQFIFPSPEQCLEPFLSLPSLANQFVVLLNRSSSKLSHESESRKSILVLPGRVLFIADLVLTSGTRKSKAGYIFRLWWEYML